MEPLQLIPQFSNFSIFLTGHAQGLIFLSLDHVHLPLKSLQFSLHLFHLSIICSCSCLL
uniref:Uncharacterized protein n=1 Tax=Arundo donax TaxID=35708 RepID=A0A0A9EYM8_ARUDO